MEAGVLEQPFPARGGLVSGVVVQDQVQVKVLGDGGVDELEEAQELLVPAAAVALGDDRAAGQVVGGEQSGGAVPHVVVGAALRRRGWRRTSSDVADVSAETLCAGFHKTLVAETCSHVAVSVVMGRLVQHVGGVGRSVAGQGVSYQAPPDSVQSCPLCGRCRGCAERPERRPRTAGTGSRGTLGW